MGQLFGANILKSGSVLDAIQQQWLSLLRHVSQKLRVMPVDNTSKGFLVGGVHVEAGMARFP